MVTYQIPSQPSNEKDQREWSFVTKIVLTYCSRKLLKIEAEGQEFAKFLRSFEQFVRTVKSQIRNLIFF